MRDSSILIPVMPAPSDSRSEPNASARQLQEPAACKLHSHAAAANTKHTERMAKTDGSPVHVDLGVTQTQAVHHQQRDDSKDFVDFKQVRLHADQTEQFEETATGARRPQDPKDRCPTVEALEASGGEDGQSTRVPHHLHFGQAQGLLDSLFGGQGEVGGLTTTVSERENPVRRQRDIWHCETSSH